MNRRDALRRVSSAALGAAAALAAPQLGAAPATLPPSLSLPDELARALQSGNPLVVMVSLVGDGEFHEWIAQILDVQSLVLVLRQTEELGDETVRERCTEEDAKKLCVFFVGAVASNQQNSHEKHGQCVVRRNLLSRGKQTKLS